MCMLFNRVNLNCQLSGLNVNDKIKITFDWSRVCLYRLYFIGRWLTSDPFVFFSSVCVCVFSAECEWVCVVLLCVFFVSPLFFQFAIRFILHRALRNQFMSWAIFVHYSLLFIVWFRIFVFYSKVSHTNQPKWIMNFARKRWWILWENKIQKKHTFKRSTCKCIQAIMHVLLQGNWKFARLLSTYKRQVDNSLANTTDFHKWDISKQNRLTNTRTYRTPNELSKLEKHRLERFCICFCFSSCMDGNNFSLATV